LLTRENDRALNPEWTDINKDGKRDHADELQARVDVINEARADVLLSLHHNAFYDSRGRPAQDVGGAMTLYCQDREFGAENLRLARLVQDAVLQAFADYGYRIRDRGVVADSTLEVPGASGQYLVLLGPESKRIARPSEMPGALCEVLFLTHQREAELAQDPVMQERLAIALADALDAYLGR
ncbi:MAG: N-acetylmuramoyl-L-alanine amidase, partial [Chloroflexi bacterium]|nr:N-acetylmuramoyl-L-alanine amidase [Chloroflexota bacterium]